MKKILALLLAAVMCLSLCACASGGQQTSNEYTANDISANGCNECYTKILGDWYSFTEDNHLVMLSFSEDGTVIIGEQEHRWYTECENHHSIKIGSNPISYCIAMNEDTLTLAEWDKSYLAHEIPVLYKNQNYTFIEITEENWQEYFSESFEDVFDIAYTFEWNEPTTNEWGETVAADMGTYYKKATLKNSDSYALCNLLLECSGKYSYDQINIDTITNNITGYRCVEIEDYNEFTDTFAVIGTSFTISEDGNEYFDSDTTIHSVQLDTILRIKGWIVLE